MKIILIILTLFLVSVLADLAIISSTSSLCYLIFSVYICSLILSKNITIFRNKNTSFLNFNILDIVYAACVGLTIISFLFMSHNIKSFHYAFLTAGMFCVYLFIRLENFNKLLFTFSRAKLLVYSLVFVAFINALIALYRCLWDIEIIGTFGYSSFLSGYLAMNVPIVFGLVLELWRKRKSSNQLSVISYQFWITFSLTALLIMICVIVLTKNRSGIVGLGIVLPLMFYFYHRGTETQRLKSKTTLRLCIFAFLFLFAIPCGHYLYKLKPVSAVGRGLIWQVSADMFLKNPASGVGFGNFASQYNYYQADYFARVGNPVQKIAASQIQHAYNWYLETIAELGVFGLIVFSLFWWLILKKVYKIFVPRNTRNTQKNTKIDCLNLGMAGSVLYFMIMSFFQFPQKIIPTFLIFNVALAWIVNANLEENSKTQIINNKKIPKEKINKMKKTKNMLKR